MVTESEALRKYAKAQMKRDRMIWWERGLARWVQFWMIIVVGDWIMTPAIVYFGVLDMADCWRMLAIVSGVGCLMICLLAYCSTAKYSHERKRVLWEKQWALVREEE